MIPMIGFTPDAEQTTLGVVAECTNLIPYLNGMEGAPTPTTPQGVPALAATCRGAVVTQRLDSTRRILAGTQAALYELTGGAWSDVSASGGYVGGPDTRWSFAQFGDATIASNRADAMQRSTAGAFAAIASAPKAEIVFSVGAFVMALNVNDGAEKPDGWHCCAAYDDSNWTPSVATQATKGRLVATAGAITAGARLGEYAVAYKARSLYLGQYVGAPVVWDWIQVPGGEAGCVGKDALCDIGGAHFFVGDDNFWLFDGSRPVPIGVGEVRQWFFDNSSQDSRGKTVCIFDRQTNRVWIFYASKNSSTLDAALVYHVLTKRWGRATLTVESALNYISAAMTIDGLTGTMDTLPDVAFDSQYWLSGGRALAVFNGAHQLQSLTGEAGNSSFTTGAAGDDDAVTLLKQLRLRYAVAPGSATATVQKAMNLGAGFTDTVSGAVNDGKFDVLQSARWHRARFAFTGDVRVTHVDAKYNVAGQR